MQFLVQRAEFEQEADELGIKVTDEEVDKRLDADQEAVLRRRATKRVQEASSRSRASPTSRCATTSARSSSQKKIFEKVTRDVKVTDEDIKAYYDKNKAQYDAAGDRDVRHILVKKKALADELYAQLKAGGDFAALAKKYSTGSGLEEPGRQADDLEGPDGARVRQGRLRAQDRRDLAAGEDPVRLAHHPGARRRQGRRRSTPLTQVKDAIRQQLLQQKKKRGDDEVGRRAARRTSTAKIDVPGRLRAAGDDAPRHDHDHRLARWRSREALARPPGADRAPAPRLPVGPRADRADDRPAHGRGGLRGRRRRARATTTRSSLDELGDLLFQVYFLALLLEERGHGRPRAGRARRPREARAPAPARLRRRRGARRPGACARTGRRSSASRRGARGSSTTSRSRCRRCSTRARCSAARRRSASSTRTSTGALADLDDELRELKEALASAGEPAPETEPDRARLEELGDVLFAAVNVARRLNVDPELALRATAQALRRPGRAGRAARRRRRARRSPSSPLDEQDRYFDARQGGARDERRSHASTAARSSTRAATRPSRSTSCSSPARRAARPCRPAPRPGSSRRSSCATATRRLARQGRHAGGRERRRRDRAALSRARRRRPARRSTQR